MIYKPITPAQLSWHNPEQPYSSQFDDIYFSRENALAETDYVFIQQNQLINRWQQWHDSHPFVILETGFGTGLNFLATWSTFIQHAKLETRLHFISIEKYPIQLNDLKKIHQNWQHLSTFSQQLLMFYPENIAGCHRLVFAQGRVILDLWLGDIAMTLPRLCGKVDAWFLDGFAPRKNPDMWSKNLFQHIARLSHQNTTFSTFTASSQVRRDLQTVGFDVKKMKGFGAKRDMLCGVWQGNVHTKENLPPWFTYPKPNVKNKHAIIIGAGLAGAATAYSLAQRGWQCTVIEKETIASGASGNRQGVVYPLLTADMDLATQFYMSAYLFTLQRLQHLLQAGQSIAHDLCGVVQLAINAKQQQRFEKFAIWSLPQHFMQFLKAEQLSQLTDFKIKNDGLYFPQGGWINPQDFCHAQLNHANIHVIPQTEITHIIKKEINWYIYTHEKKLIAQAPIVIVANSYAANQFNYFNTLPLQALQGQVTYPNETLKSQRLKTVICHEGYLTPSYQNLHSLGATYETNDQLNVSQANNHNNFEKLAEHCPNIAASFNENHIVASQARSSLRCSSLDHLPIIGFSPIYQAFKQDYQDIYLGKRWSQYPNLQPTGLYLNIAHGSRGVISTALAAEILAAQINNEPLPISADVLMALATQRFWIRQLKNK